MAFLSVLVLSLLQFHGTLSHPASPMPMPSAPALCAADSFQVVDNGSQVWPWQTYKSSPILPPHLLITSTNEALFDGLLFLDTAQGNPSTPGSREQAPIIATDKGDLIWSGPDESVLNFRVQTYNGAAVLTYFQGSGTAGASSAVGHGYGGVDILDTNYNLITTVCPKLQITLPAGVTAQCVADLHESYITDRNTMLVTVYNLTQTDMTSVGGPVDGWVFDSFAAEVNITTGDVLFMWSPLGHVPLSESHFPVDGSGVNSSMPWDWFHMNSIFPVGENYLINSRHLWRTFLVDPKGNIIWQVDGQDGGDFGPLPEGGSYSWQHFARLQQLNSTSALLHYFANNNVQTGAEDTRPSTGLSLFLTLPPNPAHPPVLYTNLSVADDVVASWSQGAFDFLPNGNFFMGYGANAVMREYGPKTDTTEGSLRWQAIFGHGNNVSSYRAYKQVWHATPATDPNLVVVPAGRYDPLTLCPDAVSLGSTMRGYVSWNGATDVTEWLVYAGKTNATLAEVGTVGRQGFETEFVVPKDAAFVQVGAIENNSGVVSRKSQVVAAGCS